MIKIQSSDEYFAEPRDDAGRISEISAAVAAIIADVKSRGDEALREYTEKFDGCVTENFEVPQVELDRALESVGADFIGIMERAAENIERFHRAQIRHGFTLTPREGVVTGQRIIPLGRVGLYIPGGTAAYPSSVLMNCIPAKIAGVGEIIMTTPPSSDGRVNAGVLAAAKIAGVCKVLMLGGAQAIAALAYGTQSVPRVDKITGPGNAFVAEAKRQVFGAVGIDMIAGPSDVLIIADDTAAARIVAADMLAQCEHGESSRAVLVTNSEPLAHEVGVEIENQLISLPRSKIARRAIENFGRIILVNDMNEAFAVSNRIAPEHLEIMLHDPFEWLPKVQNAGSVFLGHNTPEALGDYYAGPNHTLPTSGTARFMSPLSVDDFVKKSSFTYYTADALSDAAYDIEEFAEREALHAHAASVAMRMEQK